MSSSKKELPVDGNSQVDPRSSRGKSRQNGGASPGVGNLIDPSELLRSLDSLRDQLIQPYEVRHTDSKTKGALQMSKTVVPERPSSHAHCFPKGPQVFYRQPTCVCRHCRNNNLQMPLHAHSPFQGSKPREHKNTNVIKPRYQQKLITHKRCEPLAGGSPLLVCHNCFELLQVPSVVLSNGKERKKLKCGSCFQIITFQITGKKLVLSTLPLTSDATSESSNPSNGISGRPRCHVLDDSHFRYYGGSDYNAQSANGKLPVLASHSNPPPDVVLEKNQKYLDTSEPENMETESDLLYSCDARGDDEIPHTIIHKGEVLGSSEPFGKEKLKVSVNGHSIPYHSVKKAEKQAGLIQPGEYWYDYQAGFWGVMGEPCMGIIPPFIKEFNYPMPKNCAAGNTAVVVNGRELNHEDLRLLVDRGLPKSSGRSYMIDISGGVVDASSGRKLDGLGKLAPTVEKLKKGFGMRRPRIAAE